MKKINVNRFQMSFNTKAALSSQLFENPECCWQIGPYLDNFVVYKLNSEAMFQWNYLMNCSFTCHM